VHCPPRRQTLNDKLEQEYSSVFLCDISATQAALGMLGCAALVAVLWLVFGSQVGAWAIMAPVFVGLVLISAGGTILLLGLLVLSAAALINRLRELYGTQHQAIAYALEAVPTIA
jgi:hypothetical protein